jgi:hypothetical protein
MGAHRFGELPLGARRLVEGIGHAKVGDDVEAARQHVSARDLEDRVDGIELAHRTSGKEPWSAST